MIKSLQSIYEILLTIDDTDFDIYSVSDKHYIDFDFGGIPLAREPFLLLKDINTMDGLREKMLEIRMSKLSKI